MVRPIQAGRAAYGPPPPSASIQKILSARRPPFRAHQHATVRDLVRARAHSPHPITSKSCSPDVHARDENVYLRLILRCFCATILHPYHPQPLEPLTPRIHRAARSLSPPHPPIVQKYRHCFLSFSRSPQPAAFADHKRLVASRTGSDDKAAPASKDHGARTGGAPHQELLAEPHRSHGRCRHANSYRIIVTKAFQLLALRYYRTACCLSAARHAPRARRTPRSRSCR